MKICTTRPYRIEDLIVRGTGFYVNNVGKTGRTAPRSRRSRRSSRRARGSGWRCCLSSAALSLCATACPLHARFTNIFGASLCEATMRPNPRVRKTPSWPRRVGSPPAFYSCVPRFPPGCMGQLAPLGPAEHRPRPRRTTRSPAAGRSSGRASAARLPARA